jgi:hypothetical protein
VGDGFPGISTGQQYLKSGPLALEPLPDLLKSPLLFRSPLNLAMNPLGTHVFDLPAL